MKTTLGEARGGPVLIEALLQSIRDFSLLYAGTPSDKARAHLETYIGAIEPAIVDAVGASNAPILLDGMRRAIMTRKGELEAGGASRA